MYYKFLILLLLVLVYVIFLFFPSIELSSDGFYESEDKLWAHRVNNLKDIKPLSKDFKGFELDVFYNQSLNQFDVKHHGKYTELSLNQYFSYSKDLSLKYWIDFKNLNKNNVIDAISLLDTLTSKYLIKVDVIVESKNIELLSVFKKHGFSISYWLPEFHVIKSIFQINKTVKNIEKFEPDVISMPHSSVSFYSKKIPNYPIHCWANEMISDRDKDKIKSLLKRKNVKVVLTDFKYNFLK
tara:strand:- start:152 stop:871 length:720 start_codon:yes stop_codon:yes gene_type:complete